MNYKRLALILGNCLFPDHGRLDPAEDTLFFMAEDKGLCTHFRYHKHKLVLFLSAMRSHADQLKEQYALSYYALDGKWKDSDYLEKLAHCLDDNPEIKEIVTYDIEDHFFEKAIREFCEKRELSLKTVDSPGFLTTKAAFAAYDRSAKKPFMQVFYKEQRRKLKVLLDEKGEPVGGKWSFDEDNRKKLPKKIQIPKLPQVEENRHTLAVKKLVDELFSDHPGHTQDFCWATQREDVLKLVDRFLQERFEEFGPYEDAIHSEHTFLFHSALSPYINMGLITPEELLNKVLDHYEKKQTHFASVEGFVRQLIGWREFMRGIYHQYDKQLNVNHFNHRRKLKDCWYEGTTGIPPIDDAIKKVKKYAYTHHIERLMVLGNSMLLCEIDPDEVYRWFMEMYIDSSDWVMAPNVYGMSQFADGGIFATKPYIAGSNYIKKMSNYPGGDWEDTLNGLYWRFIDVNVETFAQNQRMSMMVATLKKMNPDKKDRIFKAANDFIEKVTY